MSGDPFEALFQLDKGLHSPDPAETMRALSLLPQVVRSSPLPTLVSAAALRCADALARANSNVVRARALVCLREMAGTAVDPRGGDGNSGRRTQLRGLSRFFPGPHRGAIINGDISTAGHNGDIDTASGGAARFDAPDDVFPLDDGCGGEFALSSFPSGSSSIPEHQLSFLDAALVATGQAAEVSRRIAVAATSNDPGARAIAVAALAEVAGALAASGGGSGSATTGSWLPDQRWTPCGEEEDEQQQDQREQREEQQRQRTVGNDTGGAVGGAANATAGADFHPAATCEGENGRRGEKRPAAGAGFARPSHAMHVERLRALRKLRDASVRATMGDDDHGNDQDGTAGGAGNTAAGAPGDTHGHHHHSNRRTAHGNSNSNHAPPRVGAAPFRVGDVSGRPEALSHVLSALVRSAGMCASTGRPGGDFSLEGAAAARAVGKFAAVSAAAAEAALPAVEEAITGSGYGGDSEQRFAEGSPGASTTTTITCATPTPTTLYARALPFQLLAPLLRSLARFVHGPEQSQRAFSIAARALAQSDDPRTAALAVRAQCSVAVKSPIGKEVPLVDSLVGLVAGGFVINAGAEEGNAREEKTCASGDAARVGSTGSVSLGALRPADALSAVAFIARRLPHAVSPGTVDRLLAAAMARARSAMKCDRCDQGCWCPDCGEAIAVAAMCVACLPLDEVELPTNAGRRVLSLVEVSAGWLPSEKNTASQSKNTDGGGANDTTGRVMTQLVIASTRALADLSARNAVDHSAASRAIGTVLVDAAARVAFRRRKEASVSSNVVKADGGVTSGSLLPVWNSAARLAGFAVGGTAGGISTIGSLCASAFEALNTLLTGAKGSSTSGPVTMAAGTMVADTVCAACSLVKGAVLGLGWDAAQQCMPAGIVDTLMAVAKMCAGESVRGDEPSATAAVLSLRAVIAVTRPLSPHRGRVAECAPNLPLPALFDIGCASLTDGDPHTADLFLTRLCDSLSGRCGTAFSLWTRSVLSLSRAESLVANRSRLIQGKAMGGGGDGSGDDDGRVRDLLSECLSDLCALGACPGSHAAYQRAHVRARALTVEASGAALIAAEAVEGAWHAPRAAAALLSRASEACVDAAHAHASVSRMDPTMGTQSSACSERMAVSLHSLSVLLSDAASGAVEQPHGKKGAKTGGKDGSERSVARREKLRAAISEALSPRSASGSVVGVPARFFRLRDLDAVRIVCEPSGTQYHPVVVDVSTRLTHTVTGFVSTQVDRSRFVAAMVRCEIAPASAQHRSAMATVHAARVPLSWQGCALRSRSGRHHGTRTGGERTSNTSNDGARFTCALQLSFRTAEFHTVRTTASLIDAGGSEWTCASADARGLVKVIRGPPQ